MFSNLTSPSLFNSNRRLERPPRQGRESSTMKSHRRQESYLVNNLNMTLGGLDPSHHPKNRLSSSRSPQHSTHSFLSSQSSRTTYSSTSSTSSNGSMRSFQSYRSELPPPRYYSPYEQEKVPKASSFVDMPTRTSRKTKFPFSPVDSRSNTPRPSIDSTSSSGSIRSWLDVKERKAPPPPLHLNESNLYPKPHSESPVIEIIAPGPPRVESRLSSYSVNLESPQTPVSPASPVVPTEEEVKRRRHEKVMKMLGERVPAELVYQVPKIMNVTVFPEPPSPEKENTPRETVTAKLVRRASFTLSSIPNLSSVTATLLPAGHVRTKSKDLLDALESPKAPETATPLLLRRLNRPTDASTPTRNNMRSQTHPRPESLYSPTTLDYDIDSTPIASNLRPLPNENEDERAAKLARRASLSTATFLPTSPMRDGFRDSRNISRYPEPSSPDPYEGEFITIDPRNRPASMMLSPVIFAKHASILIAPPQRQAYQQFSYTVNGEDEDMEGEEEYGQDDDEHGEDDDDSNTAGSRTPPSRKPYAQSETGHGLLNSSNYQSSRSNPHLAMYTRPETPFQDAGVPLPSVEEGAKAGYLAPPGQRMLTGMAMVSRRERRQGWSGEWNQGDMQEVIRKLRNLK